MVDSILLQQRMRQVREMQLDILRGSVIFWESLGTKVPDLAVVLAAGQELQRLLREVDSMYQVMLEQQPAHVPLLRAYGDFLIRLAGQPHRATDCLNKAERLEAVRAVRPPEDRATSFEFGLQRPLADAAVDRSANVLVSAAERNLGEILDASPAACRMVGLPLERVRGQSVSFLFP